MTKRALGLWALLVCAACPPPKPPTPPPGEVGCADVCRHEADLGCEAARPTANDVSCVAVCENVQGSSVVRWNLACRAQAPTCQAIDLCELP
jgi:hypothetical protein